MESWENIILQWINCLCGTNSSIKSVEELLDGKIYYNLINRVIPWSSKEINDNQKDAVLQFLADEYPNFAFRNRNSTISNLCTASLILSRLSLEPIFHKSLCMNLDVDAQITIKSILESVYSLGKSITAEDLCEIFSLSNKKDFKSLAIKPKFILEEFLKSPAARTIQNDKKQFEQAKQIRQLKAEIETMKYEKSELVEDMKAQDRQIRDLQNKLQDALLELKSVSTSSSKRNSCNFSVEGKDRKGLETAYEKEVESLEKYVHELQMDNYQLQDEKKALSDEVKLYKEKYQSVNEKNEHNEQAIESMLFQIEKKEDELMEIKAKYDELLNHVKEKTKTFFNNQSISNQSFEVDDRILSEISWNKSEALSSVIEIQLEEVRKDYNTLQKDHKYINVLLNIFIEEYEKLKRNNEELIKSIRETKAKLRTEYMTDAILKIQNDLIKNDYIIREKIKKDINSAIEHEVKLPLVNILKGDVSKNTLFLQLLNSDDTCRYRKALKKNISFSLDKESASFIKAKNLLEKCDRMVKIKHYSEKPPLINLNLSISQQNDSKKPIFVFKVLLQEILTGLIGVTSENDVLKNLLFKITKNDCLTNSTDDYFNLINFVKHNFEAKQKCLNAIEDNNNVITEPPINPCDWKAVNSIWTSLRESLENDVKIHKVLFLLEQSWLFVSDLLKDVNNRHFSVQSGYEDLLRKKGKIESELKNIRSENSQILSFNLIAAIEFITTLTSYCNQKTSSFDLEGLTVLSENGAEVNLSDFDKLNVQRRKNLATKIINVKRRIDNFNYSLNLYKEEVANAALKNIVQDNEVEISNDQTDSNSTDAIKKEIIKEDDCIETIKKEIIEESENEFIKEDPDSVKKHTPEEEGEVVDSKTKVHIELVKKEVTEEETISCKNENHIENVNAESIKKEVAEEEIAKSNSTESLGLPKAPKTETEDITNKRNEVTDNVQLSLKKAETTSEEKPLKKEISSQEKSSQTETFSDEKPSKKESLTPEAEPSQEETPSQEKLSRKEISSQEKSSQTETFSDAKPSIKESLTPEAEPSQKEIPSDEKASKKQESDETSAMTPQQIERYVREIHEKYELKLERMKEKMKSAFNSQVSSLRREQEQSFKSRMDALQAKLEQQCYSHSEELRKYKKHISELTTQLWDVGEKLIIEKQKKEEFVHRVKELKSRHESSVSQSAATLPRPSSSSSAQLRDRTGDKENWSQQPPEPLSKMQSVRGFQIMGNAFRSEDEEGELFDTTYLTDVQRQTRPGSEVDRLSILQLRNAKCKPHLKSSYPAEMQFYPASLTEDEIKTGNAQDETFNDSLSQSLLTGKKVKRKDRTKTAAETPRSRRRFSSIFRKPRLSLDHK